MSYQVSEDVKNLLQQAQESIRTPSKKKSAQPQPKSENEGMRTEKQKRVRAFCLTTYIEPSALDTFLRSAKWIQHFAYTTHDKDVNEDGTIKEAHTHVLLYTFDGKTSSAVKKLFDRYSAEYYGNLEEEPQNTLCQVCNDMCSQYRYQLHLDDSNKYQYRPEDRIVDDMSYWNNLEMTDGMTGVSNVGLTILNDMMRGVPTHELCQKYGKEFIYHMGHYLKVISRINYENHRSTMCDPLDLYKLLLETSPFTEEQKATFYVMFAYIQKEAVSCYANPIQYYIGE